MSELDLYAIGRCQEQVTRENLESSARSLHSDKRHRHRIYTYAAIVVLLMLINEFYRNVTNTHVSINNKYSNRTEIHHKTFTNQSSVQTNLRNRRCNNHHLRMMTELFTERVECSRWAYQKMYTKWTNSIRKMDEEGEKVLRYNIN